MIFTSVKLWWRKCCRMMIESEFVLNDFPLLDFEYLKYLKYDCPVILYSGQPGNLSRLPTLLDYRLFTVAFPWVL